MSGRYKALLIGVHEFPGDPGNLPPLRGPRHDVAVLRAALSHPVTGLVAGGDIAPPLVNPSKATAEHAIHALFTGGQRDDVLVFYFSGHGRLTRDGKLFLCTSDTVADRLPVTAIAATTLRDCMDASESQRFVVILDCCHSGAFRGGALPTEALGGRGMFCLASTRMRQLAEDSPGDGPSPFTEAVAAALCDPGSDADGDGWITFDDVYRVVYARLAPRKQYPQRSTGEGTLALARTSPSVRPRPPVREPDPIPADFDETVGVRDQVHDLHVRLLTGFAADALLRAAEIAELALRRLLGRGGALGALVDELRRAGPADLAGDAAWLIQRRAAAAGLAGQVCEALDADARRGAEIARRLATAGDLIAPWEWAACQDRAGWHAPPPPHALLRLDRKAHRTDLDDLLQRPGRVVVLLVHGEVDQGHDHFREVVACRLRTPHVWHEVVVPWPERLPQLAARLALLFEELAQQFGAAIAVPADDPTTPDGERAWWAALAPLAAAIDARERVLVSHELRWLATGPASDTILVTRYLTAFWSRVAGRPGGRVVVGFNLRRIERVGTPITRAWWTARSELAVANAIVRALPRLGLPGEACVVLPELGSVPEAELAEWLKREAGRPEATAAVEAARLLSETRGGRFDLVVDRLTSFRRARQRTLR